jgi:hypothetical protein
MNRGKVQNCSFIENWMKRGRLLWSMAPEIRPKLGLVTLVIGPLKNCARSHRKRELVHIRRSAAAGIGEGGDGVPVSTPVTSGRSYLGDKTYSSNFHKAKLERRGATA